MKQRCTLLLALMWITLTAGAQGLEKTVGERLAQFFRNYTTSLADIGQTSLDSFRIDNHKRTLSIYPDKRFGYQPFTPENVKAIYRTVKQSLPGPVNYYDISIYADGKLIEELVPNELRSRKDRDNSRRWKNIGYNGSPWVNNESRPYGITRGLNGRHIALWQSHGRYYKSDIDQWAWQRPRLFCTTEDLFTQSVVVPYLIPMLENAGAVVFTPRERDWQPHEAIVDNDTPRANGSIYYEDNNRRSPWQTTSNTGFAYRRATYLDGQNPFTEGTARMAPTSRKKRARTFAEWIPNIPESGRYAVYVSYQTLPQSITDAQYLVFHKGGVTRFSVNQRIGGGTWVYLGTFEFDRGSNDYGMVVLTNESNQRGVVCADGVRFGGGMGNVARGRTPETARTSGLPRYLEGARYQAQWSGMPYEVYAGKTDYPNDINTRSRMVNYLSGGSPYNPRQRGLGVPFDLCLALHSDAGYSPRDSLIGSLGIYTTHFNEEKLAAGGSRYASRDLTQTILTGLKRDLEATFQLYWPIRAMWNRNYSETRLPAVPSMILEMLSHQNFADMRLGHDPKFRFALARSVYKSVLRFESSMHGTDYEVQPLPVTHFAIAFTGRKNTVRLSWQPASDPLEPTATPRQYVVYTRIGRGGFDNGRVVNGTSCTQELEPGIVYSFKVTALNRGGESFPSEILSACRARHSRADLLVVNAFDRVEGPATLETHRLQGFDLTVDPGMPHLNTPALCGRQLTFDREGIGRETSDGLGYSGSELEGMLIAGNTYDYPFIHGKAIQAAGHYSFTSCSDEAVEDGLVKLSSYPAVDVILGAENTSLSPALTQALTAYCQQRGRLVMSGMALDRIAPFSFTSALGFRAAGNLLHDPADAEVFGTNLRFAIPRTPNENVYSLPSPACIEPLGASIQSFVYTGTGHGAGTACHTPSCRTFILGFPLECVTDESARAHIMAAALQYLFQ